ncbi:MAG: hypothetical protein HY907_16420 [Deltaproteobacteria bacterium]|nr:hypothetical protein [Deltaproteobacteria bacterium]
MNDRRIGILFVAAVVSLSGCFSSTTAADDDGDAADARDAADGMDAADAADAVDAPDTADAADGDGADAADGADAGDVGDGSDAAEFTGETCPGYARPYPYPPGAGEECRDDSDCATPMTYCLLPGVVVCGSCPPPTAMCATDPDCPPEFICVEVPPPCPYCPGGPGTQCIPRCAGDSCGAGFACDGSTGRCAALPCGPSFACPPNFRCTGTGDAHGCGGLACDVDGDCDCGVCASGRCVAGPGVCSGPAA